MYKKILMFLVCVLCAAAMWIPRSAVAGGGGGFFSNDPWVYVPVQVPVNLSDPSNTELHYLCAGKIVATGNYQLQDFTAGLLNSDGTLNELPNAVSRFYDHDIGNGQIERWLFIVFSNVPSSSGRLAFAANHLGIVSPPCRYLFAGQDVSVTGEEIATGVYDVVVPFILDEPERIDPEILDAMIHMIASSYCHPAMPLSVCTSRIENAKNFLRASIFESIEPTLYVKTESDVDFHKRLDISVNKNLNPTEFTFKIGEESRFDFYLRYSTSDHHIGSSERYSFCEIDFVNVDNPSLCVSDIDSSEFEVEPPFDTTNDTDDALSSGVEADALDWTGGGACSLMPQSPVNFGVLLGLLVLLFATGVPVLVFRRR